VKFNPSVLIDKPGNWRNGVYVNKDPLNFVDPSGSNILFAGVAFGGVALVGGAALIAGSAVAIAAVALAAAPAVIVATIATGVMISASPTVSLYIGTQMALSPIRTSILSGIGQGILDKGFDLRTGFPNTNDFEFVAQKATEKVFEITESISNDFSKSFEDSWWQQ
jgi:hypothetical protein